MTPFIPMITVLNDSRDPYYNQAFEEYVFRNYREEDVFLLWRNDPCVVIGSFQNAYREVDVPRLLEEDIPVIRRISGGGTVYHDRGNFNYSVILNRVSSLDYEACLAPMLGALQSLGIDAYRNRVCDIALAGKKISGSAQRVEKNRILHHGTLLFDADLTAIERITMKSKSAFIQTKASDSAICAVGNIADIAGLAVSEEEFGAMLLDALVPREENRICLSGDEEEEVRKLMREKYRSDAWTWGKTPAYRYERKGMLGGEPVHVDYQTNKGIITEAAIGSVLLPDDAGQFFRGVSIDPESLYGVCRNMTGSYARELFENLVGPKGEVR